MVVTDSGNVAYIEPEDECTWDGSLGVAESTVEMLVHDLMAHCNAARCALAVYGLLLCAERDRRIYYYSKPKEATDGRNHT
jgi:hypothetical protein